jgi:hypothetical protein
MGREAQARQVAWTLALMRVPILIYQLVPILVLLLPLIVAVGCTLYWRRSLSNPWLYGLAGVAISYAIGFAVAFAAEQFKPPSRGTVVTSASPTWRNGGQTSQQTQTPKAPETEKHLTFEPFTPSWYGLLGSAVLLCGLALWGLTFAFRITNP